MNSLAALLNPLDAYEQFVVYKLVPSQNGKTKKLAWSPTSQVVISALDPVNWLTAEQATLSAGALGSDYGVSLLAEKPKFDKSWLVNAWVLLVAAGRPVIGHQITKSPTQYVNKHAKLTHFRG